MCTGVRFSDSAGGMYLGRNLDWSEGYGERVVATPATAEIPRAFERPGDAAVGHAVIGMGIIAGGVPLYFDCGNDAGLAIAGLNFPQSACYAPDPVEGAVNVAAYEFPYWVARNFSSLAEVREALQEVVIVARSVSPQLPVASLHWLIGDATGSIVVEYMADGLHVWENDVDVLTNEPDFGWQRTNLRNYLMATDAEQEKSRWGGVELAPFGAGMGAQGIPGDYSGPARFVRAAFVNTHYPAQSDEWSNVVRMFRTLGAVAVPDGCARMAAGGFEKTLYTSCFSAASMTYYHATYDNPQIVAYPLSSVDCSGTEAVIVPAAE